MRDVLTSASMKVVEARTAQEGLTVAFEIKPDLILLDIRLPGMDGYVVLEQLRGNSATAAIPVVALTAQAMVGDREQALAAGFSEYIAKPIDTRTLAAQVCALMGPGGLRRRSGGRSS